jgi:hypothetical protein
MARATAMARIFINSTIILKCYIKLNEFFIPQKEALKIATTAAKLISLMTCLF